ncbi:LLM class F420-dependent oxidoreductase, partial [Streptomyces diastatochromogenes]
TARSPTSTAAAAPPPLSPPRWRHRGGGGRPLGPPRDRLPAQIDRLAALREQAGIEAPFTVGAITEPLYVGHADWHLGRRTLSGAPEEIAESLRAYRALGVHQIQVRFRSRSRSELIDQIGVFGAEVAPRLD